MNGEAQFTIRNNPAANCYEATVAEHLAFADYHAGPHLITFTHTEVPEEIEGQGVGSRLIRFALDEARTEGRQVAPLCPFAADFIRRHPEYAELVHPNFRYMVR